MCVSVICHYFAFYFKDVTYLAVMTANQGYMLYSDLSQLRAFTCVRVTGTHTANIGVTVE